MRCGLTSAPAAAYKPFKFERSRPASPAPAMPIRGTAMSTALRFNAMHFMPYVHLPPELQGLPLGLGEFPEQVLRPEEGQPALPALSQGAGAGRPARLRRAGRERASQHGLQHDGRPQPHRGRPRAADHERADLRVGDAAQSHAPQPPGRGVRHARRDVGRAAGSGVPARDRDGILGPPGQSRDGPRQVPGIARDHPAGLEGGRPHHPLRHALHVSLPQSVAAAVPEAAPALLHRGHGQSGDDRDRGRAGLRLRVGVRAADARA